jgi:IS66 Orf2 like protein
MIGLPAGTRIWIVAGVTDMRRGFVGLSGMVQTALQENPFSGQVYIFRGRRGDLIKVLWFDGDGRRLGDLNETPYRPRSRLFVLLFGTRSSRIRNGHSFSDYQQRVCDRRRQ